MTAELSELLLHKHLVDSLRPEFLDLAAQSGMAGPEVDEWWRAWLKLKLGEFRENLRWN
jgi:hypothetical protein